MTLGVTALLAAPALDLSAQQSEEAALPDMTGRWAQMQYTTSISEIPIVGDVTGVTTSLLLLEVTQDGGAVAIKETVCDITITTTAKRVETIIPRAFQKAASGTTRKATLSRGTDGVIGFVEKPKTVVLGAKLKKRSDALPEEPDDERVLDADGDGHPGLTVKVKGLIDGDIYVVQRGWNKLTGAMSDEDSIFGSITWSSEQTVLDASSFMLKSNPTSKPDSSAKKNYFKMKRVDDAMSCKQLREKASSLF